MIFAFSAFSALVVWAIATALRTRQFMRNVGQSMRSFCMGESIGSRPVRADSTPRSFVLVPACHESFVFEYGAWIPGSYAASVSVRVVAR